MKFLYKNTDNQAAQVGGMNNQRRIMYKLKTVLKKKATGLLPRDGKLKSERFNTVLSFSSINVSKHCSEAWCASPQFQQVAYMSFSPFLIPTDASGANISEITGSQRFTVVVLQDRASTAVRG